MSYSTYITTWDTNKPYQQVQEMINKSVLKTNTRIILSFASFNFSNTNYIPGINNMNIDDLKKISTTDSSLNQSKMIMMSVATQAGPGFQSDVKEYIDQVYGMINYNLNVNFDGRKVVGDNPNDINDKKYGNPNVKSTDVENTMHGTHVAGIIAQTITKR